MRFRTPKARAKYLAERVYKRRYGPGTLQSMFEIHFKQVDTNARRAALERRRTRA